MEILVVILCGMLLGGANVIPGVSGGTVAVMLGLYEKLVGNISEILPNLKGKNWKGLKGNILFLLPLIIGTGLGIILFSKIVSFALKHYFVITMYAFLGLILGSLPTLFKKTGASGKDGLKTFVPTIITFAFALLLFFLQNAGMGESSVANTSFFFLFVCGIIASSAMIIPGISGSFILMLLGLYTLIVETTASIFDFAKLFSNLMILIPFGLGIVVGILVVSKLMDTLLKKYYKQTFLAVIGFVVGSLPILAVPFEGGNWWQGVLACAICAVMSFFLMKTKEPSHN